MSIKLTLTEARILAAKNSAYHFGARCDVCRKHIPPHESMWHNGTPLPGRSGGLDICMRCLPPNEATMALRGVKLKALDESPYAGSVRCDACRKFLTSGPLWHSPGGNGSDLCSSCLAVSTTTREVQGPALRMTLIAGPKSPSAYCDCCRESIRGPEWHSSTALEMGSTDICAKCIPPGVGASAFKLQYHTSSPYYGGMANCDVCKKVLSYPAWHSPVGGGLDICTGCLRSPGSPRASLPQQLVPPPRAASAANAGGSISLRLVAAAAEVGLEAPGYAFGASCDVCRKQIPPDASMWHNGTPLPGRSGGLDICMRCLPPNEATMALRGVKLKALDESPYSGSVRCDACRKSLISGPLWHSPGGNGSDLCSSCLAVSTTTREVQGPALRMALIAGPKSPSAYCDCCRESIRGPEWHSSTALEMGSTDICAKCIPPGVGASAFKLQYHTSSPYYGGMANCDVCKKVLSYPAWHSPVGGGLDICTGCLRSPGASPPPDTEDLLQTLIDSLSALSSQVGDTPAAGGGGGGGGGEGGVWGVTTGSNSSSASSTDSSNVDSSDSSDRDAPPAGSPVPSSTSTSTPPAPPAAADTGPLPPTNGEEEGRECVVCPGCTTISHLFAMRPLQNLRSMLSSP